MNAITRIGDSRRTDRFRFPAYALTGLAGTSFKHEHLPAILAQASQDGFFEVHAENYMGAGGPAHAAARLSPDQRYRHDQIPAPADPAVACHLFVIALRCRRRCGQIADRAVEHRARCGHQGL